MATVKEQFDSAKAYIEAKQYDKARRILKGIQHPKADEWLVKLDQMPAVKARRRRQYIMIVVILVALVIIVIAGTYFAQIMNQPVYLP